MHSLAIKMALRDYKKILLIALVLAFAGSMFIYYHTVMYEMRHYSANEYGNKEDAEKFRNMKIPKTRSEQLVSGMSMLVLLAAGLFQLNMLVVDMINKKREYYALEVIGVSQEHVELFPLLYSVVASIVASFILVIFWLGMFPHLKHITKINGINFGLLIIVMICFSAMSTIIGVKAKSIAEIMER